MSGNKQEKRAIRRRRRDRRECRSLSRQLKQLKRERDRLEMAMWNDLAIGLQKVIKKYLAGETA